MVFYKMVARDCDSIPTQYRTWIVANFPDFSAQYYYGSKSGNNALTDISAYAINDPTVIADFNLPLPASWSPFPSEIVRDYPIYKVLPADVEDAQLAVIDGYVYMFGGKITNAIYMASVDNPADWTETGATLPTPLYGASLAIINNTIYLFGGNNGTETVDTIFSAPVSNPLNWTNTGSTLPGPLQYSNLGMYNTHLNLFGGQDGYNASNVIYQASTTNPLAWSNSGFQIPVPIYGSVFAQIDGYWMIFGGQISPEAPTSAIWSASINEPTVWALDGYLPYPTSFGKFVTVGASGYIIGPMVGAAPTGFTPIIQCDLATPSVFQDTMQTVRGVLSHSQIAIIYDRIWLFGGSGESAIFACNQQLKYNLYDATVMAYGTITRVLLPATNNINNPYEALCFPYWQSDYFLSPPPTPPPVPPPPGM
jgi:hypothetical protein